jgi:4-amino-4-deoxy-L-arabinose transferase-like glycosyltransferase
MPLVGQEQDFMQQDQAKSLTDNAFKLRDVSVRLLNTPWMLWLALLGVVAAGVTIRMVGLQQVGLNSDEAVYVSQAAGILNNAELKPFFPLFRAHPLLYQFILALTFAFTGVNDYVGRVISVIIAALTIVAVFALGKSLYSSKVGLLAAFFIALMPYHVVVTRQVLLDGPMTLCATLTLCALAHFGKVQSARWLYATGLCLGLTFLAKETGIVLLGAVFLFLALNPAVKVRLRDLVIAAALMLLVIAVFPLVISLAGAAKTGQSYLVWQLLRQPNHDWTFYGTTALPMMGVMLLLAAVGGIAVRWKQRSWRETLLVAWILVPAVLFELWPVKGFQYLLPITPAIAVLGASAFANDAAQREIRIGRFGISTGWLYILVAAITVLTLALPSWNMVQSTQNTGGLAGTGGVPGGRETGLWFQQNTAQGSQAMAIGPSAANLIQFYGYRKTYMLSISTNPLQRNPAYEPILNPDLPLRNGEVQYIVWDAYSADRSKFFSERLLGYVRRYNGRIVHTETVNGKDVFIVYEVHP